MFTPLRTLFAHRLMGPSRECQRWAPVLIAVYAWLIWALDVSWMIVAYVIAAKLWMPGYPFEAFFQEDELASLTSGAATNPPRYPDPVICLELLVLSRGIATGIARVHLLVYTRLGDRKAMDSEGKKVILTSNSLVIAWHIGEAVASIFMAIAIHSILTSLLGFTLFPFYRPYSSYVVDCIDEVNVFTPQRECKDIHENYFWNLPENKGPLGVNTTINLDQLARQQNGFRWIFFHFWGSLPAGWPGPVVPCPNSEDYANVPMLGRGCR